jgi:predicted acyltransferase
MTTTAASSSLDSTLLDAVDRTVAPPADPSKPSGRLVSLDVFRGLVIVAMLIVNNLGDNSTTGYFWKHADWPEPWLAEALRQWWHGLAGGTLPWYAALARFPVFRHCTLADYVMPSFMLIIGLAIPYSVAASVRRGVPTQVMWLRTLKRAATLVLLGWIICYFRDQFAPWLYGDGSRPLTVSLGMDVLQLLGDSYLLARVLYELPGRGRIAAAAILLLWHWAFLRFGYQGDVPRGTFTEHHNAVGYAYAHWPLWGWLTLHLGGRLTIGWIGLLSVPPATATMLLGTVAGDWLRRRDVPDPAKVRRLALWGGVLAAVGLAWAFDLPFNKPRWTPCYLVWVSGIGFLLIALLYWLIDMRGSRRWVYPFVVFGSNAIAAYFISIMVKILIGNTPRVTYAGQHVSLTHAAILSCKHALGPWAGGWAFTLLFITFWWAVLDQMYRRKWFWKL